MITRPNIIFRGLLYGSSGYANETRSFLRAALQRGLPVQVVPLDHRVTDHDWIDALRIDAPSDPSKDILYHASPAHLFTQAGPYRYWIGRTMFETDRLPQGWSEACNFMDEVWVPSHFNMETFARSGVDEEKLRLVPAGIDTHLFSPDAAPLTIPNRRAFNFLSVFDWQYRKGWDVLLRAFTQAFHADDEVSLTLKVSSGDPFANPFGEIEHYLTHTLRLRLQDVPPIIMAEGDFAAKDLPGLYTASDAFVLASRGEGYGRPYLEAMACGLPTIGTRWSGQLDFMTDQNSYLIDIEGFVPVNPLMRTPTFAEHLWAEPSASHLAEILRTVATRPADAVTKSQRARHDIVSDWDESVCASQFAAQLQRVLTAGEPSWA